MEKKQTAVEWLVEEINKNGEEIHKNGNWIPTHMIEQAKQMEKEEIIDSYEQGDKYKLNFSGEQYYNETYGGNNE
jgi:predicted transcriptional regulator